MAKFAEVKRLADALTLEERERLLAYLIEGHDQSAPSGASDQELKVREAEMDSGAVRPLTEEEFFRQVRRPR